MALFRRKQPDPEPASPVPSLFGDAEVAPDQAHATEAAPPATEVQLEIDLLDWRERLAAQVVEQFAGRPLPVAGYIAEFQLDNAAALQEPRPPALTLCSVPTCAFDAGNGRVLTVAPGPRPIEPWYLAPPPGDARTGFRVERWAGVHPSWGAVFVRHLSVATQAELAQPERVLYPWHAYLGYGNLVGRADAERLIPDAPQLSAEVRDQAQSQVRQWPRRWPRYRGHFDERVQYEPGDVVMVESATPTVSGMAWKVF